MKIFDAFLFFNELDLLEIRCEELKGIVDKHFLIESPNTIQGSPKLLYYHENESLFRKYPIEPIVIEVPYKGIARGEEAWQNEFKSRDLGFGAVAEKVSPDDILLLSDADEIPRASKILESPESTTAICMMSFHYYWLNFRYDQEIWAGTVRTPAWKVRTHGGQAAFIERKNYGNLYQIQNGGWHYSYLGGVEGIQEKIRSFSHSELNTMGNLDPDHLKDKIETGRDLFGRDKYFRQVQLDGPQYLLDNVEKFKHLVK